MCMQGILDSSFARPGSAPIWGGKKVEFRGWTRASLTSFHRLCVLVAQELLAPLLACALFLGCTVVSELLVRWEDFLQIVSWRATRFNDKVD